MEILKNKEISIEKESEEQKQEDSRWCQESFCV